MATDIFLYAGESSPNDVKLRDPTTSGASVATGTIAWVQAGDSWGLAGVDLASSSIAWTQANDAWALSGASLASGPIAWTQAGNTWALSGVPLASGTVAWSQAADTWALAGAALAAGSIAIAQDANLLALSGASSAAGPTAWSDAADSWAMSASTPAEQVANFPAGNPAKRRRKVIVGDRLYEVESLKDVEFLLKRIVRADPEPVLKAAEARIRVVDRISADVLPQVVEVVLKPAPIDWTALWRQLEMQDRTYADLLAKVLMRQDEDDIETLLYLN